jgi:hypothetical protein
MMKTILLLLTFSLATILSVAQHKTIELSHYIFPEFVKGTVLMHTGIKNIALLNYNALTEEMIFDTNGRKLAMDKLQNIDTIFIENRKFLPYQNKFVELIYHNKYELYAAHKCKLVDPGKPSAYGGTSQTSATTAFSSFSAGGQLYELSLPEGYGTIH